MKWKKKLRNVILAILVFHLLAFSLMYCSFSRYNRISLERAEIEKPFDVILVPGVPYDPSSENKVLKMRMFWAQYLYVHGYAHHIIYSGSSVYSPYREGEVMKAMSDSMGIPPEVTFSETRAEHSTENVFYGRKMAKEKGFGKMALATDPFQSGMLRFYIRNHAPDMYSLPLVFDQLEFDSLKLPAVDTSALRVRGFVPLPDRESFWERLRGTMGKNAREGAK